MTARQLEVLRAIETFLDAHGWPPTLRELCEVMGLSSTNGMQQHVQALERKGYVVRDERTARGLRVVVASSEAPVMPGPSKTAASCTCPHCGKRVA